MMTLALSNSPRRYTPSPNASSESSGREDRAESWVSAGGRAVLVVGSGLGRSLHAAVRARTVTTSRRGQWRLTALSGIRELCRRSSDHRRATRPRTNGTSPGPARETSREGGTIVSLEVVAHTESPSARLTEIRVGRCPWYGVPGEIRRAVQNCSVRRCHDPDPSLIVRAPDSRCVQRGRDVRGPARGRATPATTAAAAATAARRRIGVRSARRSRPTATSSEVQSAQSARCSSTRSRSDRESVPAR